MIALENIVFRYGNGKEAIIDDISISLNTGNVLVIVGPSGGGKSTLLRIIAGLETPSSGRILVEDKLVSDEGTNVKPENRNIGMVFQDYALFPHMNVQKNIEFGIDKLDKKQRRERVNEVLNLVELNGYEKRYPHELSGGQQQRVALARALAPKPKLLLLDEPFSNLDPELMNKVRDDFFKIIREARTTTILVTHNPDDAKKHADQTIKIKNGKLAQD